MTSVAAETKLQASGNESKGLGAAIQVAMAAAPNRSFTSYNGGVISRGEFLTLAAERQAFFRGKGVGTGDVVFVASGRDSAFWIDLAAIWGLGGVVVPFDSCVSAESVRIMVETARPVAVVGAAIDVVGEIIPCLVPVDGPKKHGPADEFEAVDVDGSCRAAILFTSGSTGRPKGVDLSHGALLGNSLATLRAVPLTKDDRLFISIPFHFTSAINHFLAAVLSGATLLATEDRLVQSDLPRRLIDSGATCFGGAPLQLRWIGECALGAEVPQLSWLMSSGDHLPVDVIRLLGRTLPTAKVYTVYGLTEVGGRFCILTPEWLKEKAGSVGKPIQGLRFAIRDENGEELPTAVVGEVCIEGAYLFDGYIRNIHATQAAFRDGQFRTGDLGYVDADGFLFLSGRADDVFKSAGQKVSVVPIAAALMETGLFDDVAVVPMPHPQIGAVPHVLYVLSKGREFQKGPVMRYLRSVLPATHMPQGFAAVSAIPRTGSGKIRRTEARALAVGLTASKGEGDING